MMHLSEVMGTSFMPSFLSNNNNEWNGLAQTHAMIYFVNKTQHICICLLEQPIDVTHVLLPQLINPLSLQMLFIYY